MKKLMTMIAAVATAFGLFADEPTYNGTSFESAEAGVTELKWTPASGFPAGVWSTTIEDALDLGAYDGDKYVYPTAAPRRDDQFKGGIENLNYLKLDTGSATVDRAVADGQLFYDQVIKFTGFEDMQTNFTAGTKIALWTSAIEDDEDTDGVNEADTNLYVAVGNGLGGITNVQVKVAADFDFNAWHRVTIKNAGKVSGNYLGFFVWIDGVMAEIDVDDLYFKEQITAFKSYYDKGQLFISMDGTSATVANIGFQGVGSLDDVVVDADGPAFAVLTVPVTVLAVDGAEIESVTADGEDVTADKGVYNVTPGAQVVITFAPGTGKMFKGGNTITKTINDATTINPADEDIETADIIATVAIGEADPVEYYDFALALADIQKAELAGAEEISVAIVKAITGATFGDNMISLVEGAEIVIAPLDGTWTFKKGDVTLVADIAAEKSVTVNGNANTLTYGGIVAGKLKAANLTVADSKTISLLEGAKIITKTTGLEKTILAPTGYQVVASEPEDDYITYTVEAIDYVAEINGTKYKTLAEAIAEVGDGQTITMLADVPAANGISVPGGKNFTVDFDGHSYLVEKPGAGSPSTQTQAFQLLEGSTIVFKNGTIGCTADNKTFTWTKTDDIKGVAFIIQNYANLTLEGMTINGENIAKNGGTAARYLISNNSGEVVLNNTTINANEGDFAFDTCKFKTSKHDYAAPTVEVKGTSAINGDVELSGGNLTLTAGTLTGKLVATAIGNGVIQKAATFVAAAPADYKWDADGKLVKIEYATLTITAGENVTAVVVTNAAGVAVENGAKFDKDDAVVVAVDLSQTTFADNFELDAAESTLTVTLSKDDAIIVKAKAATPAGPTSDDGEIAMPTDGSNVATFTPSDDQADEATVNLNGSAVQVSFPKQIKTIKGVPAAQIRITSGTYDITDALTFTGDTTGITYALNEDPTAKVAGVPVTPTIAAEDMDFDITGGTMEVKGIAGLYYTLVGADEVTAMADAVKIGDSVQATDTGATVKLADERAVKPVAQFYQVKVTIDEIK